MRKENNTEGIFHRVSSNQEDISNKPEGFDDKDLQVLSRTSNEEKKRRFNSYKTNCKSGKRPY